MNEVAKMLSINETAGRLSLRPETVRRMLRRGELRGVKFGKVWRVPLEGLRRRENAALDAPASTPTSNSTGQSEARQAARRELETLAAGTRVGLPPIPDEALASDSLYAGRGE